MHSDAIATIREALNAANQLVDVACDWNLDEVEIDGEMKHTRSLARLFDAALSELDAIEQGDTPPADAPMPDENGLLPCPFCGGKANPLKAIRMHYVVCKQCGAGIHGSTVEDEARQQWNKRQRPHTDD